MLLSERAKLKISGIYLIRNKINNKCYIGQAKNICSRIYNHLHSTFCVGKSDYNYPLHAAIRKYGIDNFELELLEQCESNSLNEREQYWISYYNSRENGYNQTNGGYQSIRLIKLTDQDVTKIRNLLIENKLTNAEIANMFNIHQDTIHRINVGRMWHDDSISYPIRKISKTTKYHFNGTYIQQFSLDEELLNSFPSLAVAAMTVTGDNSSGKVGPLSRCCRGLRQSAYGFKWKLVNITEAEWLNLFYS